MKRFSLRLLTCHASTIHARLTLFHMLAVAVLCSCTHPAAARPHVPDGYTLFSHSGNTLVLSRPTGPKAASPVLCPPNACLPALKVSGDGAIAVNPALARTRRGNGLCAWQQLTSGTLAAGTYALYCASYDTFNNRWRAPKNLSEGAPVSGSDALEPQVAVDKCGHGMTVWKQANGYDETSSTTVYNIVGRPYTLNWKRGEKLLEPANISLDHTANADLPNLKISACCQGLVAWQETYTAANQSTATVIWVSGKTSSVAQQHVESTETLSAGDATNQVSALRSSGGGSISLSSAPGTVFIYVVGDIDGDLDINLEAPSAFAVAAPTKSIGDPSIPSITLTVNEGKKISGHCAINIKPESTVGNCSLNIDKAAVIEDYCTVTVGGRIEEACSLVINGTVECTTGGYNVGAGVYVSGGYIGGDCSIVIESGTVTGKGSSSPQETSVAGIGIAVENRGRIDGACSVLVRDSSVAGTATAGGSGCSIAGIGIAVDNWSHVGGPCSVSVHSGIVNGTSTTSSNYSSVAGIGIALNENSRVDDTCTISAHDNSTATGDGSGGGGANDYNSIAGIGIAVDNSGSIGGVCSIAIDNSEATGDGSGGGGGGANDYNSIAGIGIAVDNSGSISGDCSIAINNSTATGDGSGGGGDNNRFNSVAGIGIAVDSSGSISGDCSIAIDNSEATGDGSGGGGDNNWFNSVAGIGIAVDNRGSIISGDCSIAINNNSEAKGDGSGGGGDNDYNSIAGIGIAVDYSGSISGDCSIAIDNSEATGDGSGGGGGGGDNDYNSIAGIGIAVDYSGSISGDCSIAIDNSGATGDGSGGGGGDNWFNSVAGIGIAVDNGGSIGGVCSIAIDSKGVATVNAQGSDSSNSVASFGAALNYGGKINANLSIAIDGTVCGDVAVAATNDSAITGTITASGSGCVSGSVTLPTGVTGSPSWIGGNQTCTACSAPSLSTSVVKPANPEMAATVAGTTESEAAAPKAALQQPPDAGGTRSARINRTHQQSKPTQQPTVTLRSGAIKQAAVLKAAFDVVSSATCPPLFIKVDNLDVSCPPVIVNAVTACGYDACTGTFNAPQGLEPAPLAFLAPFVLPTLPRVALDDNGHGIVVWQRQDEMLVSHAYACPYDYDVATGDFGLTFTLANGSQAFTPDADLGGCGCGIIAWAQTSTADDKRADIWACTYNPVTKELGTALLISDGTKNAVEPRVACDCRHRACVVWRQANADGTTYSVWANVYNMTGAQELGGPTNISLAGPAELGDAHNLSLVKLDNRGRYRAIWQQVVGVDSFGKPITNVFARAYAACYGRWGSVVNMSSPCDTGGTIDGSNDACSGKMASNMRGGTLVAWQTTPTGTDDYAIWACRCATFGCQTATTACKETAP